MLQLQMVRRISFDAQEFFEAVDPRGKDPIRLDLSGNTETRRMWINSVITNLGIYESSIKNIKQTVVYRNYWTFQKFNYFFAGSRKKFP